MVAPDELPVYIVSGSNWECEVPIDTDDASLPKIEQMMEAATKAIEILKGVTPSDNFRILDHDASPYLGVMVHVFLKNTNPEKGQFVSSYIALANGGFYEDSIAAQQILREQQMQEEGARDNAAKKLVKDLNNFDKLRLQLKKGKTRKGKSRKKDK